jgi:hypothetical protein
MTTNSGTHKFELERYETKEGVPIARGSRYIKEGEDPETEMKEGKLMESPLIISGPLEELENLYLLLMLGIDSAIKNDSPKVKESGIRWMDKVRQQIKDQEFENLNQNA